MAVHDITLMGRELRIRSEADPERLERLARYVDETIAEVAEGTRHAAVQNVLLMAALNLAEEVFSLREDQEALREKIRAHSRELLDRMARAA